MADWIYVFHIIFTFKPLFFFRDSFVLQWSDGRAWAEPCHQNYVENGQAPADGADPLCPRLTCCQTDHKKRECTRHKYFTAGCVHSGLDHTRTGSCSAAPWFPYVRCSWTGAGSCPSCHVCCFVRGCRYMLVKLFQRGGKRGWLGCERRSALIGCGGNHTLDWHHSFCGVMQAALPVKMWSVATKRGTLVFPLCSDRSDALYPPLCSD